MPKLAERWVVVGDQADADQAAEKWRFSVHGFGDLIYQPNPVTIQHLAEERWKLEQAYAERPRGTDPQSGNDNAGVMISGGLPLLYQYGRLSISCTP